MSIASNQKKLKREKTSNTYPCFTQEGDLRRILHRAFLNAPSGKSPKQIADECQLSAGTLYNTFNRNYPFKFSLAKLLPFCFSSGDHSFLMWFAGKLGYQCYRLPEPLRVADVSQLVGDLLITGAELQKAASELLYRPGAKAQKTDLKKHLEWILAISTTLRAALEEEPDGTE